MTASSGFQRVKDIVNSVLKVKDVEKEYRYRVAGQDAKHLFIQSVAI